MKKMKVLNYTVKIHPAEEGGFWAEVPVLPGCYTQGETIEEIAMMARDAIECYLGSLSKDGEPIPIEKKQEAKKKSFSIPLAVCIPQMTWRG